MAVVIDRNCKLLLMKDLELRKRDQSFVWDTSKHKIEYLYLYSLCGKVGLLKNDPDVNERTIWIILHFVKNMKYFL